jgi:hypothetical protein
MRCLEDVKSLRAGAKEVRAEVGLLQHQLAESRSNEMSNKVQNEIV